jgi:hypothetical protein
LKLLSSKDKEILELLIGSTQIRTKHIVSHYLKRHYKNIIETKDYIIATGDIPVAIVAHLDTVFEKDILLEERELFYDEKRNVAFCPQGAGFDDKAGVFAILKLISSGLRPHIIFTTDEEVGGKGASELAKLVCPFEDLRYVIELDRRGSNDCVFYDCDNQEFIDYIEKFGFEWNFGSYSDICEFCPTWEIAGVNLSIGYRDEHSVSEVLFVGQMLSTIDKVKKMLSEASSAPVFKYIPAKNSWTFDYSKWYQIGQGVYSQTGINKCFHCGKYHLEEELIPAVMLDRSTGFYCPDCMVDNLAWCNNCGEAYQKASPQDPSEGLCLNCKDLKEKYNVAVGTDK